MEKVRKLRLKIFLPLPRSNTRRTCCCPGHSTRKPRSYRLEARTLHLDPGLLPLEGLRTTLDIVKKKNRNGRPSGPPAGKRTLRISPEVLKTGEKSSAIRAISANVGNKLCTLIIDSGSDCTIVKYHPEILPKSGINTLQKIHLAGISGPNVETMGTAELWLREPLENFKVSHVFHVVETNFPIPADGLIGNDFFNRFICSN
ncbi:unnamed protein product [Nesidiocoris tenuis]|uniref:Peptidase A2 domain-containing protein n=1 Tax=Nesidiocoris tenuis TaxID=355587 RepID=A0A6H5H0W9_9HEMI|nr:unnamed protein product [Nesidiocoris tenuis]